MIEDKTEREKYLEQLIEDTGGYDSLRIFLNPTKKCTKEEVTEDLISFFEGMKSGKGMTHLFTVGIDKDGNKYSEVSEAGRKLDEVTEEEKEAGRKLMELIKNKNL